LTATHVVALSMLGVPFAVDTDDERIAELVRVFWEPFVGAVPEAGAVEVSIARDPERWRLESPGEVGAVATDPWVLGAVLRNLLTVRAVALSPEIVPLHASVVERDGSYLVLSGPSEAGKTTLMLELLARGWRYVSDDMAPIDRTTSLARPLRKPLSVRDPARWEATTDRWEVPGWLPRPTVASLVPPGVFEAAPEEPYRPGALVFSSWVAGADASFEALSGAEAVAATVQNLQFKALPDPGDVSHLAAWAGAAPAFRIRYGNTADALRLVERAIGG
jgi:hypothetical protein